MERKSFDYTSKKTGAVYKFAERNRADVSFSKLQDKIRAKRVKFIQENIPDEEQQRVLLMMEMNKVYNFVEIENYINDELPEVQQICFDSFKINNNEAFEQFKAHFNEDEFYTIRDLITELEYSNYYTDAEVKKALMMDDKKFERFQKEQTAVYAYAKKHIKKKLQK